MTKHKWAAFYAVTVFVDVAQLILLAFGIGVGVNTAIDFVFGPFLAFTLHLAGVSMTDPKRVASILAAFGFETLPIINALPLWTLDLILIHAMYKGEEKLKKAAPTVVSSLKRVSAAGQRIAPLNKDGVRLPRKNTGDDEIAAAFSSRDTI